MSQSHQNQSSHQTAQTPFWQFVNMVDDLSMDAPPATDTVRNTPPADATAESSAPPGAAAHGPADPGVYATYGVGGFPGAFFPAVAGKHEGKRGGKHGGRYGRAHGHATDFFGPGLPAEGWYYPHQVGQGHGGGRHRGRHQHREAHERDPTPTSSRSSSASPDEGREGGEVKSHPLPPRAHSTHPHPHHAHAPHHPPHGPHPHWQPSCTHHPRPYSAGPPPRPCGRSNGRRHKHARGTSPPPYPTAGAPMQHIAPWIQNLLSTLMPPPPTGTRDAEPEPSGDSNTFTPAFDLFTTAQAFIIHISLPGAKKEDLGVHYAAATSTLTISGVVYRPCGEEVLAAMTSGERKEVGMFERKIVLSQGDESKEVDGDGIVAKLEDGILVVTVPRLEKEEEWESVRKVDIL